MPETESASKVIGGEPVKKVKTMLVDENGVDIEQMQDIIRRQADMIENLSAVVESRDAEDAEITRKLICSKTSKWATSFTFDELIEFSKDELDDLHKFVCRVGRVDLTEIDEAPAKTVYKAARRFPKSRGRDGSGSYNTNQHKFSITK